MGSIPGRVIPKTLKMVLDTSLLSTQQYKVLSRVKWSNPGKGVAPSLLSTQQYKVLSRVKWSNPGKGVAPSLHLGIVAIEKGAF